MTNLLGVKMKNLLVKYEQVSIEEVADTIYYNNSFDYYFYKERNNLYPIKDYKDFAKVVANNLICYQQLEIVEEMN